MTSAMTNKRQHYGLVAPPPCLMDWPLRWGRRIDTELVVIGGDKFQAPMLTRLQVWLLLGSVPLTLVIVMVVFRPWIPRTGVPRVSTTKPSGDAPETAKPTRAKSSKHVLPEKHFVLTTRNNAVVKQDGQHVIDADTELKYAHERTSNGIVVTFYSFGLKNRHGGEVVESFSLSRDGSVEHAGTLKKGQVFDDLPHDQQQIILASFATNHCTILVDAHDNEIGRVMFPRIVPSAINEGLLNTTRLVHGPFWNESATWTSTKRVPMEHGFAIDCPVHYTKGASGHVKVSGSFSTNEIRSPLIDVTISNVSCRLSGTLVFDETLRDYTSGQLTLSYSFDFPDKGAQTGSIKGRSDLSLQQITRSP